MEPNWCHLPPILLQSTRKVIKFRSNQECGALMLEVKHWTTEEGTKENSCIYSCIHCQVTFVKKAKPALWPDAPCGAPPCSGVAGPVAAPGPPDGRVRVPLALSETQGGCVGSAPPWRLRGWTRPGRGRQLRPLPATSESSGRLLETPAWMRLPRSRARRAAGWWGRWCEVAAGWEGALGPLWPLP